MPWPAAKACNACTPPSTAKERWSVSSLKVPPMFHQVPQPLHYAEALLERFAGLARTASGEALLGGLVEAAAQLSGCGLSQLYLLDDTHTRLTLSAEWQDGLLQPRAGASLSSDYDGEQLLQYCLCQNQVLSLDELDGSLHQIGFLPEAGEPWRSLLRLPQRLRPPRSEQPTLYSSAPCASGYGLIGDSAPMRALYQMIGKVLHNPVSVLLAGETGTGKELVARAIHDCGLRRSKAFVVQNCASLPENLLESELFGYRKGAFSGAAPDHQGLFDAANGGTLFLDEIGDMPLSLQAKLLRVLQEGEVRPLGSTATHKVDVRIVAATHHHLRNLVEEGRFREDLFYRLAQWAY